MDKSVVKRIKISYGIFTSLLLVSLLCLAFCSLLLVYSSNNIAYADNGYVNDNLIKDNDFSFLSSPGIVNSTTFNFTDNWVIYTNSSTVNHVSYGLENGSYFIRNSGSTNVADLTYIFSQSGSLYSGQVVSIACCVSKDNTNWDIVKLENRSLTTNSSVNYFQSPYMSLNYQITSSGLTKIWLRTAYGYTCYMKWVKFELGSSFTGYVPKNYSNYGYNQGYDQGYLDNGFNDMPINFYSPSYYSQQLNFLSSSYSLDYNGISYSADFDQYYDVNNVYRSEYVKVDGKNPIIHFNIPLNSNRFSISFGIDIHSNYSNLTGILLVGNSHTYYYDVASNNSIFNSNIVSSNRCIYYTLNIELDYLDSYYINLLFDNSGSIGSCIVLPIVVSSTDISSRANPTELGYNAGYDDGSRYGYNNGYSEGYNVGYNNGFDNGSDGSYSWYSLFGAIYDVPINAFNGMFDLNILGINLKGFILGLISLCIVLFILKIVFK